jgi:hypothetical protein
MTTPFEQFSESDDALEAAATWAAANPAEVLDAFLESEAGNDAFVQWCVDAVEAHELDEYEARRELAVGR